MGGGLLTNEKKEGRKEGRKGRFTDGDQCVLLSHHFKFKRKV